jgi:hypothetical protein
VVNYHMHAYITKEGLKTNACCPTTNLFHEYLLGQWKKHER